MNPEKIRPTLQTGVWSVSDWNKNGGLIIGLSLSVSEASMTPRTRDSLSPSPPSPRETRIERED